MCVGDVWAPTAEKLASSERQSVSSPLPMQVVSVVEVTLPNDFELGTSRRMVNSLISPGRSVIEYTLLEPSYKTGVPPHEGFVQSIEVVVSTALPRFSMRTYASALKPGIPYPSDEVSPSGPTKDNPRVRSASIGIHEVV